MRGTRRNGNLAQCYPLSEERLLRLAWLMLPISALLWADVPRLEEAIKLHREGKLQQAREVLRTTAAGLRASGDRRDLARALRVSSQVAISLGDYRAAIGHAREEIDLRRALRDEPGLAEAHNTLGLAHLYLAEYPAALENYQRALSLDRAGTDAEGQNIRLNNIGNVYYFQGRYLDALRVYQQALEIVDASPAGTWSAGRRQVTVANLATVYQRLGKERSALELYQQLGKTGQAMPRNERAQLLLNQGALYRRMGDPVKAIELYRAAQSLFAAESHRDGEIGALRNIGIARAVDLDDLSGALEAFTAAVRLARQSSNNRGVVQASLYRAEVLRRLDRLPEAEADARTASEAARTAGLVEEQWKALYALGRIAEDSGRAGLALDCYRQAIGIIESVREGLQRISLRSEFLADKRDVYDSLIALRLREPSPPAQEIFSWLERSRSRTLRDRLAAASPAPEPSLAAIQSRLPPGTLLIEYWMGSRQTVALWITPAAAGLVRVEVPSDRLRALVTQFDDAAQKPESDWRELSRTLGGRLLTGVPLSQHLIVVPDGVLSTLPFEALVVPGGSALLIENRDVSYLPSAQLLVRSRPAAPRWIAPWRRQLVAFGDPPASSGDTLPDAGQWPRLPASAGEVLGIAGMLAGRAEIHLGTDAQKSYLLDRNMKGLPLLHFSTHAVADPENPERSRILLASDYIYQEEVYNLDLTGVGLVTVSACDTARGKFVRGEGVEAFPRAFLAAGASATITSLWRVADAPAADFMQQLYYYLEQGQSKAEALRSAKLRFLRSGSSLSNPRHWAAFVLNGDGWNPCSRAIPWSFLLLSAAAALAAAALAIRPYRAAIGAKGVTVPAASSPRNPNT